VWEEKVVLGVIWHNPIINAAQIVAMAKVAIVCIQILPHAHAMQGGTEWMHCLLRNECSYPRCTPYGRTRMDHPSRWILSYEQSTERIHAESRHSKLTSSFGVLWGKETAGCMRPDRCLMVMWSTLKRSLSILTESPKDNQELIGSSRPIIFKVGLKSYIDWGFDNSLQIRSN
jgi:hypothetical protein